MLPIIVFSISVDFVGLGSGVDLPMRLFCRLTKWSLIVHQHHIFFLILYNVLMDIERSATDVLSMEYFEKESNNVGG
uniref:Uncharacterized protein n=1 Tax=Arundo donax TaxID=35708 RepID=A0A0A9G625_ARUDO